MAIETLYFRMLAFKNKNGNPSTILDKLALFIFNTHKPTVVYGSYAVPKVTDNAPHVQVILTLGLVLCLK